MNAVKVRFLFGCKLGNVERVEAGRDLEHAVSQQMRKRGREGRTLPRGPRNAEREVYGWEGENPVLAARLSC